MKVIYDSDVTPLIGITSQLNLMSFQQQCRMLHATRKWQGNGFGNNSLKSFFMSLKADFILLIII
jgi:hypothetical protein